MAVLLAISNPVSADSVIHYDSINIDQQSFRVWVRPFNLEDTKLAIDDIEATFSVVGRVEDSFAIIDIKTPPILQDRDRFKLKFNTDSKYFEITLRTSKTTITGAPSAYWHILKNGVSKRRPFKTDEADANLDGFVTEDDYNFLMNCRKCGFEMDGEGIIDEKDGDLQMRLIRKQE